MKPAVNIFEILTTASRSQPGWPCVQINNFDDVSMMMYTRAPGRAALQSQLLPLFCCSRFPELPDYKPYAVAI